MSIFNSLLHEDNCNKDEPHNTWDDSQEQDDNSGFGDTASDIKHKQNSFADESADVIEESTDDSGFDGLSMVLTLALLLLISLQVLVMEKTLM